MAPAAVAPWTGLGPTSRAWLARIGIGSLEALRAADAVQVYLQLKAAEPRTTLNMLYGLVAAQEGRPWQVIARERRTELLLRLDMLGQAPRRAPGRAAPGATKRAARRMAR